MLINLPHREANYEMLNGRWEFLLHVIRGQELFTEGKISITLKPQLLQVCNFKQAFTRSYTK